MTFNSDQMQALVVVDVESTNGTGEFVLALRVLVALVHELDEKYENVSDQVVVQAQQIVCLQEALQNTNAALKVKTAALESCANNHIPDKEKDRRLREAVVEADLARTNLADWQNAVEADRRKIVDLEACVKLLQQQLQEARVARKASEDKVAALVSRIEELVKTETNLAQELRGHPLQQEVKALRNLIVERGAMIYDLQHQLAAAQCGERAALQMALVSLKEAPEEVSKSS